MNGGNTFLSDIRFKSVLLIAHIKKGYKQTACSLTNQVKVLTRFIMYAKINLDETLYVWIQRLSLTVSTGNTAVKELCGFADLQGSFFYLIKKVYTKNKKLSIYECTFIFVL